MHRRTAWRHWWITAAAFGLSLITVIALYAAPGLNAWATAPAGVGWAAVVVSAVINRPRPFSRNTATVDRERQAAIKAARRGIGVQPPALQRDAVDTVRREMYSVSLSSSVWGLLAVNWAWQQSPASELYTAFVTIRIISDVMLLLASGVIVYYGLVLRRLNDLDLNDLDAVGDEKPIVRPGGDP
jgi:hypothetical protein